MRLRVVLTAGAFSVLAGAIAFGVLADAREARVRALLHSIESAEERIPYTGIRQMIGSETLDLRISSRDGRRRIEFAGTGAPKTAPRRGLPTLAGFPALLKPAQGAWKKRIKDYDLAVRNYDVRPAGTDTVAGRACEVIEVVARHPGRASYRVAADASNRFPLRFEVLVRGEKVFETRFKEIEYDPVFPAKAFEEARRPEWLQVETEAVEPARLGEKAGFEVWVPRRPPAGFELRGAEVIRMKLPEGLKRMLPKEFPVGESAVVHLNYTDGIAALAVVECPKDAPLWRFARRFVPGLSDGKAGGGKVVAQKISDRGGAAYVLELGDTALLVAGNVAAEEIEPMLRTFERR